MLIKIVFFSFSSGNGAGRRALDKIIAERHCRQLDWNTVYD